jgi:hypothetical protein
MASDARMSLPDPVAHQQAEYPVSQRFQDVRRRNPKESLSARFVNVMTWRRIRRWGFSFTLAELFTVICGLPVANGIFRKKTRFSVQHLSPPQENPVFLEESSLFLWKKS